MNAPCICPACGQDLPELTVNFDAVSGIVVGSGKSVELSARESDYFSCLAATWPRLATREYLLSWVYAHDADSHNEKTPDVFIGKIRKKLKPTGIDIQTLWGRGYRLVYPEGSRPTAYQGVA